MATLQTQLPVSPIKASPHRQVNSGHPNLSNLASNNVVPGNLASGSLTESGRPYLVAGRRGTRASVDQAAFIALPMESEDAKITGATRSLQRRLLALNLPKVTIAVRPVATTRPGTRTA